MRMKKEFVRATGENGIKALVGNTPKIPKKYTHEIKIEEILRIIEFLVNLMKKV